MKLLTGEVLTSVVIWRSEYSRRKKKNTPLHMACEKGHIEIVKLLVEAGSNVKAKNKFHKTPFDASANEETRMALPGGFSKV